MRGRGREPRGLAVVGDGAVLVALSGVRKTALVVDGGELGIEPDGLIVVGDGAVVVAFGFISVAPA